MPGESLTTSRGALLVILSMNALLLSLRLASAFAVLMLSACASVSVRDVSVGNSSGGRPKHVYVADFETAGAEFKVGGKQTPAALKEQSTRVLSDYLVKNISAHVAPASRATSMRNVPRSGWLVTGRFVRVNTGSRMLRAGVGLGAGGTKMETEVQVFDLATGKQVPFLSFGTTGGSNAMPGLLTSTGPASAALSITTQSMMGVTDDAARTSRMITGALSEYMHSRGWIRRGEVFEAKNTGEFQVVHRQFRGGR